jgi:hypothetical protein
MTHTLTDEEAQELIDLQVTAWELVRLGFPSFTQDACDYMLWEKTGFPLVRGVHDIVDEVAALVIEGPRCDEPTERKPHFRCRRKVSKWGDACHEHRAPLIVKLARPGGDAK